MTKFFTDMMATGLKMKDVSDIHEVYSKLLKKAFELNIDFSKILAEDEVVEIAKMVKEGTSIKEAFESVLNKKDIAKEVKVALKELL